MHVTDFGLAKSLTIPDALRTTEGAVVGTPIYMSPEQAAAKGDLGPESDVYSLGVVFYELLAGRPPFQGENYAEVLPKVQTQDPTPLRTVRKSIPRDLEAICLKCLEKSPDSRYRTAHELKHDIDNWLEGMPIRARRISYWGKTKRWCFRNPAVTVAFVGMLLALIFGAIQWQVARSNMEIAVSESNKAKRNVVLAGEVIRDLAGRLSRMPRVPPEIRKEMNERAIEFQARLLDENPDDSVAKFQQAFLLHNLANVFHDLREFETSNQSAATSIELLRQIPSRDDSIVLRSQNESLMASNYRMLGRPEDAIKVLEISDLDSIPPITMAYRFGESARTYISQEEFSKAKDEYLMAVIVLESGNQEDLFVQAALAQVLWGLAHSQMKLGEFRDADLTAEEAWTLQEKVTQVIPYHEDSVELSGRILRLRGELDLESQDFGPASKNLEGAIRIFEHLTSSNSSTIRFSGQLFAVRELLSKVRLQQKDWDAYEQLSLALFEQYSGFPISQPNDDAHEYRADERQQMCLELFDACANLAEHLEQEPEGELKAKRWLERASGLLDQLTGQKNAGNQHRIDAATSRWNEMLDHQK
ncbi:MAG: serine/threonine-protein kinase [Pirellulaceae bacterium]